MINRSIFDSTSIPSLPNGKVLVNLGGSDSQPYMIISYTPKGFWSEAITVRVKTRLFEDGLELKVEVSHSSGGQEQKEDSIDCAESFTSAYLHAITVAKAFRNHFQSPDLLNFTAIDAFTQAESDLKTLLPDSDY